MCNAHPRFILSDPATNRCADDLAFLALMSAPTWNFCFSTSRLGVCLGYETGGLLDVFRGGKGRPLVDHEVFLQWFGIRSRLFQGIQTYCLLGIGALAGQGPDVFNRTFRHDTQPICW